LIGFSYIFKHKVIGDISVGIGDFSNVACVLVFILFRGGNGYDTVFGTKLLGNSSPAPAREKQ